MTTHTDPLKMAIEALEDSNGLLRMISGDGVEQSLAQIHDNYNVISALTASAQKVEDEREAFEKWYTGQWGRHWPKDDRGAFAIRQDESGDYLYDRPQMSWESWQARAALSKQEQEPIRWNKATLVSRLYNDPPSYGLNVEAGAEIQELRSLLTNKHVEAVQQEEKPDRVTELEKEIKSALSWIEIAHRPPTPEPFPAGEMVRIRRHALADLHKVLYGEYAAPPQADWQQSIATAIKYPDEWDMAAYPTLESALDELAAWHKAAREAEAQHSKEGGE